jgi:anti-anti-sigma factor
VQSAPFSLTARQQGSLVYLALGGDFDRAAVGHVQSTLARFPRDHFERVVFDLSSVTFMDGAALRTILLADQRARREGFDVVVVRPPPMGARVFTLSRAGEHLTLVNAPEEAGVDDAPGPVEFRRLAPGDLPTCARCRSNPAVWQAGQAAGGPVTLDSPDGPICGGCVTRAERIELGEVLLGTLRRGHPEAEGRIKALEEALVELRNSEPAD